MDQFVLAMKMTAVYGVSALISAIIQEVYLYLVYGKAKPQEQFRVMLPSMTALSILSFIAGFYCFNGVNFTALAVVNILCTIACLLNFHYIGAKVSRPLLSSVAGLLEGSDRPYYGEGGGSGRSRSRTCRWIIRAGCIDPANICSN